MGLSQDFQRDPFLLPSGVRLLSKNEPVLGKSETKPIDTSPLPLKVKAILISDHIRLASIDRYIVTVGDSIYDEKVLEIKADQVVLGKGDKKRTIFLDQSPIKLTVEEVRRKTMKIRIFSIFFLSLLLAVGCASPPKKERMKLPSQMVEPAKPQPPPEEKLKEIVVPQREEAKKVPEKLYSFFARDSSIQDVLLAFSRESDLNIVINPELTGKVTIDLKRVTLKEALSAILTPLGWTYQIDGNLIKILRPQMETRFFTLNYIATKRSGKREIYASTGGGL